VHLVATSRNGDDFGLTRAHKDHEVSYGKLDIASSDSIHNFVESFKKQHDHLDVLINNAGININAEDTAASVTKTLNVNYRGTLQVCIHASMISDLSQSTRFLEFPNEHTMT
jgi:carbonyl reductase 1